jgi:hypothetical protein
MGAISAGFRQQIPLFGSQEWRGKKRGKTHYAPKVVWIMQMTFCDEQQ